MILHSQTNVLPRRETTPINPVVVNVDVYYIGFTQLTFPVLLCVASKYVISTLDNCHSRPFAVAARVKVGGSPAISGSAIYQGIVVASVCQGAFQPTYQGLALFCGQYCRTFKGTCFHLVDNALNLIKFSSVSNSLRMILSSGTTSCPVRR